MSEFNPAIKRPVYTWMRASDGKLVKYCPYTVKDDKLLLMAAESGDPKEIVSATRVVVQNCINAADPEQLKTYGPVGTWPIFDVNYLYVLARARSVSEKVKVSFTCQHVENEGDEPCGNAFDVELDIEKAEIKRPARSPTTFKLADNPDLIITMKLPTYNALDNMKSGASEEETSISIMADSIASISKGNESWSGKDLNRTKLIEFVESMTRAQFDLVKQFLDGLPYMVIEKEHTCSKCGFNHKLKFEDLQRFF